MRADQRPLALNQAALLKCRFDEACKERMRIERAALQFRMVLNADEPRMVLVLDGFRQETIRRHAGEYEAAAFQLVLVVDIDFVAVAVTLGNIRVAVDVGNAGIFLQRRLVGAEAHRAAEIAGSRAFLKLVALDPFRHQADDRLLRRTEFGRGGLLDAGQIAGGFENCHLHAEADAEIRHLALAGKAGCIDLALCAALAETAGNKDAMDLFKPRSRILLFEDLRFDPLELDLDLIGDAP